MSQKNNFPSGNWSGFYKYSSSHREHSMDLVLKFDDKSIEGSGHDDIGKFVIRGSYNPDNGEADWTKRYKGQHDVHYKGFKKEDDGIWGTWKIREKLSGGFHIWPEGTEERSNEESKSNIMDEDVELVTAPLSDQERNDEF